MFLLEILLKFFIDNTYWLEVVENEFLFLFFNIVFVACKFESKWKSFSRKSPRKRENEDVPKHLDETSLLLLQHKEAAQKRVKGLFGCCHLEIDWPLNLTDQ
jgi:hypothetical protein